MKEEALALAKSKQYLLRRVFNWGPKNRDLLALNDRDIEMEYWANYFFGLISSDRGDEADDAVKVLEAHGDEAFSAFVAESERLAKESDARDKGDTVSLGDDPADRKVTP